MDRGAWQATAHGVTKSRTQWTSAEAAAVRRVTGRAPPPGWGLGLQLPEREEKGEVKGEGPPEVPPPQ